VKVRGPAFIEEHRTGLRIRIRPEVVWSWGINPGADGGFHGVQRRNVDQTR